MTDLTRSGEQTSSVSAPMATPSSAVFPAPVRAEVDGLSISSYAGRHSEYLRTLRAGTKGSSTAFRLHVIDEGHRRLAPLEGPHALLEREPGGQTFGASSVVEAS